MRLPSPLLAALSASVLLLPSCSGSNSPDDAMRDLISHVARGKVSAVWHALPGRYQKDLTELRDLLAQKLEPEIYDEGFALARQFFEVMRDKIDLIDGMLPPQMSHVDLAYHGDSLLDLCDKLATSEVSTVSGVKALNFPRFLDTTGNAIAELFVEFAKGKGKDVGDLIQGLTIDVQSSTRDTCVLLFGAAEMPMKFPLPCQRVDGKWLPTSMVQGWQRGINQLRDSIREMPSMSEPETRQRMLRNLTHARGQLRDLRSAMTADRVREVMARPAPAK